MSITPDTVSKIMSSSGEEFTQCLGVLLGRAVFVDELPLRIAVGAGQVEIARVPLKGVCLGGLLELPRAQVTIIFVGVSDADRTAFQLRFDQAFQRGGG